VGRFQPAQANKRCCFGRDGLLQTAIATGALSLLTFGLPGRAMLQGYLVSVWPDSAFAGIISGLTWAALAVPHVVIILVTHGRPGRRSITAVATACLLAWGYALTYSLVSHILPTPDGQYPVTWVHVSRAVLGLLAALVYSAAGSRFAQSLTSTRTRSFVAWAGLLRPRHEVLLLAAGVGALLALPWPIVGALGDSVVSAVVALESVVWSLVQGVVFWGVIFNLLTATLTRTWVAAMTTLLLYSAAVTGSPARELLSFAVEGLWLAPLGVLFAELRARDRGVWSVVVLGAAVHGARALFVDPRDAIQLGIPEPLHIVGQVVCSASAALIGAVLWVSRRLLAEAHRQRGRGGIALVLACVFAVVCCGVWGLSYVTLGEPGFADDGFLIVFDGQVDLDSVRAKTGRLERLEAAYQGLVTAAESAQTEVRAELDRLRIPYRRYYIINMIRVDGHWWLMQRFQEWPGVSGVVWNPNVREYRWRIPFPYGGGESSGAEVQDNLDAIHADKAWRLGAHGDGIVVAGQDTGYEWNHPALLDQYRGWDGDCPEHDYNWHDAWDDTVEPFDDDGHGTHTMGIVVGDDGKGNRVGVAPAATWIGCRNMRRGIGNPGSYAECLEYFLAPYPHGGDPFTEGDVARAPHVVTNSWGCPEWEGCSQDTLEGAVQALRAAGIIMVVGAGNDGPACGTAATPPAGYDAAFSVGATDNEAVIVDYSSRGPVGDQIKPDVTAPGAYVRSSVPGGRYGFAGGTSMATPHVAGLVALVWSAQPGLVGEVEATEQLVCQTARPMPVDGLCSSAPTAESNWGVYSPGEVCACGGATGVPNNVYGCGFVDAREAVVAAIEGRW
jgi:hypothetical protein